MSQQGSRGGAVFISDTILNPAPSPKLGATPAPHEASEAKPGGRVGPSTTRRALGRKGPRLPATARKLLASKERRFPLSAGKGPTDTLLARSVSSH